MVRVSDVLHSNHVCSIWQPCASDSGSKIAVSAHGMRKVQTLAFAVSRSDWRDGRDVMLRNILPQIDPTLATRAMQAAAQEGQPVASARAATAASVLCRAAPHRWTSAWLEKRGRPASDAGAAARRIRADGPVSGPTVGHRD